MTGRRLEWLFRLARLGAALSLAVTVAGMLVPGPVLPEGMAPDYILHAVGFGMPALMAAFAAGGSRRVWHAMAAIAVAALVSEAGQALVPARTVSATDLVADAIGIALGAWIGRSAQTLLVGRDAPRAQS